VHKRATDLRSVDLRALAVSPFWLLQRSADALNAMAALATGLISVIIALVGAPALAGPLPKDYYYGDEDKCVISWNRFLELKPGASYEEAVRQLGCDGKLVSRVVIGLDHAEVFEWHGDTEEHCSLRAIFASGLVDNPIRPTPATRDLSWDLSFDPRYRCLISEWNSRDRKRLEWESPSPGPRGSPPGRAKTPRLPATPDSRGAIGH
jgi:hypothetical protein